MVKPRKWAAHAESGPVAGRPKPHFVTRAARLLRASGKRLPLRVESTTSTRPLAAAASATCRLRRESEKPQLPVWPSVDLKQHVPSQMLGGTYQAPQRRLAKVGGDPSRWCVWLTKRASRSMERRWLMRSCRICFFSPRMALKTLHCAVGFACSSSCHSREASSSCSAGLLMDPATLAVEAVRLDGERSCGRRPDATPAAARPMFAKGGEGNGRTVFGN